MKLGLLLKSSDGVEPEADFDVLAPKAFVHTWDALRPQDAGEGSFYASRGGPMGSESFQMKEVRSPGAGRGAPAFKMK